MILIRGKTGFTVFSTTSKKSKNNHPLADDNTILPSELWLKAQKAEIRGLQAKGAKSLENQNGFSGLLTVKSQNLRSLSQISNVNLGISEQKHICCDPSLEPCR